MGEDTGSNHGGGDVLTIVCGWGHVDNSVWVGLC